MPSLFVAAAGTRAPPVSPSSLTRLQTSTGFFDASKSFVRITQTLEGTCAANLTTCKNTLNDLATQLVLDSNCAVDYGNDNPQVVQAYNGLVAYEPLYQASCLKDDEGSYCTLPLLLRVSTWSLIGPF